MLSMDSYFGDQGRLSGNTALGTKGQVEFQWLWGKGIHSPRSEGKGVGMRLKKSGWSDTHGQIVPGGWGHWEVTQKAGLGVGLWQGSGIHQADALVTAPCVPATCPQAHYFAGLSLSFCICKIGSNTPVLQRPRVVVVM